MFGIHNDHGSIVGFSGRTTGNHPAKYLNSPDSPVFSKGRIFYGLHKAKRSIIDGGEVVVVEGQIDVIRCHLHGIKNVVAPLGTAFTNAHGAAVRRLCGSAVLVFDADKAGQEAARKAFAVLSQAGVKVRALVLPNKQDPDEFIMTGGNLVEAIAKATSYPEALASSLVIKTAEDKVEALKKVGFAISQLDEEVIRDSMAGKLAGVIGVAPSDLKKHIAMAGGHDAIPTQSAGAIRGEGFRHLISHLLFCGKGKARHYNWSVINEPVIHKILETDYEAGSMAAITKVLATLDGEVESSICGVTKSEMESVDIKGVYKTMLEQTIKTAAEEVASTGEIDKLMPLLTILKQLE
jgi:DNA primase